MNSFREYITPFKKSYFYIEICEDVAKQYLPLHIYNPETGFIWANCYSGKISSDTSEYYYTMYLRLNEYFVTVSNCGTNMAHSNYTVSKETIEKIQKLRELNQTKIEIAEELYEIKYN